MSPKAAWFMLRRLRQATAMADDARGAMDGSADTVEARACHPLGRDCRHEAEFACRWNMMRMSGAERLDSVRFNGCNEQLTYADMKQ